MEHPVVCWETLSKLVVLFPLSFMFCLLLNLDFYEVVENVLPKSKFLESHRKFTKKNIVIGSIFSTLFRLIIMCANNLSHVAKCFSYTKILHWLDGENIKVIHFEIFLRGGKNLGFFVCLFFCILFSKKNCNL